LFLMAPSQRDFTTRTRVDDSMQFPSEGVGLGFFCYVDFVTFYFVRTGYFSKNHIHIVTFVKRKEGCCLLFQDRKRHYI